MTVYAIQAGIQVSTDNTTWYPLTDHNRDPIQVENSLIEESSRMANGKMRKYVIASKRTFTVTWKTLTSSTNDTVDGNYSSAWLNAFYSQNVFSPIYIKFVHSASSTPSVGDTSFLSSKFTSETTQVFITKFDITTSKRNEFRDLVDMTIEFTEV